MNLPRFPTAAVVLGMHRSGTSALAGLLTKLGFTSPRTGLPANAANAHGFWESEKVNGLDDEVFAELGMTWHGLQEVSAGILAQSSFEPFRRRADEVLRLEFDEGVSPIIKDPRMCRLLPLWRSALDKLAERTIYLISFRNPVDVSLSLTRRNDFERDLGLMLWARYYLDVEAETRGLPRSVVSYEGLVDDWRSAIATVREQLDLSFVARLDDSVVAEFISEKLRHHRSTDTDVRAALERIPVLAEAHSVLASWAAGKAEDLADHRRLDAARQHFDALNPFLADVFERARLEQKRRVSAQSKADEAVAELKEVRLLFSDARDGIVAAREGLEDRIQTLGSRVKKLIGEAGDRTDIVLNAVESLLDEVRDRSAFERLEREVKQLAEEARERSVVESALQSALEHNRAINSRIQELEQERDNQLAELRRHASDARLRDEEADRLQDELSLLQGRVKTVTRKYRSTQEILERERKSQRETRSKLANTEAVLATYRRSLAWRAYMKMDATLSRAREGFGRLVGDSAEARRERDLALIHQSSLFDSEWYLDTYPDVAVSGIDPAQHYLNSGWCEGRDPGPGFSTTAYLKANSDVAAHAVNPLVHYVEYGHSEGRSAPEHAVPATLAAAPLEDFGPAAPCFSVPLSERPAAKWLRSRQIDAGHKNCWCVGDVALGYVWDDAFRGSFDQALATLNALVGDGSSADLSVRVGTKSARLVDIWHTGTGLLRTRWRPIDAERIVVRVVQQWGGREPMLIAEGLVESDFDLVDARLLDPLSPVLFVFATPEGKLCDWEVLAFPSLARGGLHYTEYVALGTALEPKETLGVAACSETLMHRLAALRSGEERPLVTEIAVDLKGADGAGPVFQPGFQEWLTRVMHVAIRPHDESAGPRARFLADSVKRDPSAKRQCGGATLVVAGDMFPSISVLVARFEPVESSTGPIVSLLILGGEASQPATLVRSHVDGHDGPAEFPLAFPKIQSGDFGQPDLSAVRVTALRMPRSRALTDAELLVPVASPHLPVTKTDQAVTWLIWPESWQESQLLQSLESLAVQEGVGPVGISFVGSVAPPVHAIAERLFSGPVRLFAEIELAMDALETSLVGYFGTGVVLHDPRTVAILVESLATPDTISASPVLVAVGKRGKGWVVDPVDAGMIFLAEHSRASEAAAASHIAWLWRSSWPALCPPRDLWLSRIETVRSWADGKPTAGRYLCTALVTASYCCERGDGEAPLVPPPATAETVLTAELVVG